MPSRSDLSRPRRPNAPQDLLLCAQALLFFYFQTNSRMVIAPPQVGGGILQEVVIGMVKLYEDPSPNELLDRIVRLENRTARLHAELTELQKAFKIALEAYKFQT